MPDGSFRVEHAPIFNWPNAISFARLCAVPFAVWLVLRDQMAAAFSLFALAGTSDALDGWLARRRGGSRLGAVLDPLADKALLIGMVVTLAWTGVLPVWFAVLVVGRDTLIVGGVLLMLLRHTPLRIRPLLVSKASTALQLTLVGLALLLACFGLPLPTPLVWVVAAVTLGSGAAYVVQALR